MDGWRVHICAVPPAQGWPWWIIGFGSWAPASSMQPVLPEERGSPRVVPHRPNPLDRLPACTFQTLELCSVSGRHNLPGTPGMGSVWQYYGAGRGTTTFRIRNIQPDHQMSSEAKHTRDCIHCPVHTSASFGAEVTRARPEGPDPKKLAKSQRYSMMRDVRKEFTGSYSTLKEKQDGAGRDQSSAPMHPVDPNIQGMKWMKECQCSYRDVQLGFWLLLRPLTDRGKESTHQLARRLLSVWQWSLAVDPPPPHILPRPHQWTSDIGCEKVTRRMNDSSG